jgi:hypothetical protein
MLLNKYLSDSFKSNNKNLETIIARRKMLEQLRFEDDEDGFETKRRNDQEIEEEDALQNEKVS